MPNPLQVVAHATTPEDLRDELRSWFTNRRLDALNRATTPNMAKNTRNGWIIRAIVLEEAIHFLSNLTIVPKPKPKEPQL